MNQNNNIEEVFRNAFDGYEEEVSPKVWESVSRHLETSGSGSPDASSAGSTSSPSAGALSGIAGKAALWITGAAIVAASGVYYYNTTTSTPVPATETQAVSGTETAFQSTDLQSFEQQQSASYGNETAAASDASPASVPQTGQSKNASEPISQNISQAPSATDTRSLSAEQTSVKQPVASNSAQPAAGKSDNSGGSVSGNIPASIPPSTFDRYVPIITAAPTSGYAPLKVRMAFYGDAAQTTWNTGDGSDFRTEGSFDHVYDQPGEYVVELTTTDPEGVKHTTKTTIVVKSPSAVGNIPNVFTPNGDGINDRFQIEGEKLTQLEVAVFNKAGKQVYRWNGPDGGWDGRLLSGETAPEGTYFYVIFARGADERSYQYKGTITLIR